MECAVTEVDRFGMPEGPRRIGALRFVAGISAGGGVATFQIAGEPRIANGACETAVPNPKKFAVPAGSGQPHFEIDIRVAA